jgi:3,2-trans-enoyl-CoA isomerase
LFILSIYHNITNRNEALSYSIKTIEANPKIQSVILSSTNPKIFCAGLDIAELIVNPDDKSNRLTKFWNSLQQVYIDLYGSRLATVAAMNGHAPAAGCLLALMCDYRIMSAGDGSGKNVPTIGLNETKLGIACSPWMAQMMVSTIGTRKTELALALGTLFPPQEALAVGLVDSIVPTQHESFIATTDDNDEGLINLLPPQRKDYATNPVLQNAYTQAQVYAKIPPHARVASKMVIRDEPLFKMIAKRDEDLNHFCGFVTQKSVQKNLAMYVEAMKSKGAKK